MTQFYCKYTNVDRAGFSKCGARLEVIAGPTEWCVLKFFMGASIHKDTSHWWKKLGSKDWRRDMDDVTFHHLAVILRWN